MSKISNESDGPKKKLGNSGMQFVVSHLLFSLYSRYY